MRMLRGVLYNKYLANIKLKSHQLGPIALPYKTYVNSSVYGLQLIVNPIFSYLNIIRAGWGNWTPGANGHNYA